MYIYHNNTKMSLPVADVPIPVPQLDTQPPMKEKSIPQTVEKPTRQRKRCRTVQTRTYSNYTEKVLYILIILLIVYIIYQGMIKTQNN